MPYRLGILTTHPIQYQVPWFRKLAQHPSVGLTVFYGMLPDARQQGDGFGVEFEWDVPLLDGYRYKVLPNVAPVPSVTAFGGCDTPGVLREVRGPRSEVQSSLFELCPASRGSRSAREWDAFIVNGWVAKSCLQVLAACRRYGVPCVVRGEANDLRPRGFWKRALHRLLLRQYAAFLHIGAANRAFYVKNGAAPRSIFFAPYCIDNEFFRTAAERLRPSRTDIRAAWGIPANAVTFLFCGKFVDKKRPLDVLKALQVLQNRSTPSTISTVFPTSDLGLPGVARRAKPGPQAVPRALTSDLRSQAVHLLMVGDGELKAACEAYAAEHRLPVTFAGFLNQGELPRAYAAADCLVLPSDNGETWGLVVNEAMACGLPAVVSDQVGCHPDLVDPHRTGAVYPCGDVNALAGLLARLARQPRRLREMGATAQRLVLSRYHYDQVVAGTLEALHYLDRRSQRSRG